MTSAYATGLYMQGVGAQRKSVYVVGEAGLAAEMELAGLRVVTDENLEPADYVVAGLDRKLTYAKLLRAHREIVENGAAFVATNRDSTYPMETGTIPGGGAIVAPIECSTGVTAVTIGKPEPGCWLRILEVAGSEPSRAMMVGDRPETDIMGAKAVGLHTALVLTGVTSEAEVPGLPEAQQPEFVIPDLTALPELALRLSA
jgi:HAD superfamily hydrolase (TIGR01450 family)